MSGAIFHFLQYVLMAWCLVKHRDNFTFLAPGFEQTEIILSWHLIHVLHLVSSFNLLFHPGLM